MFENNFRLMGKVVSAITKSTSKTTNQVTKCEFLIQYKTSYGTPAKMKIHAFFQLAEYACVRCRFGVLVLIEGEFASYQHIKDGEITFEPILVAKDIFVPYPNKKFNSFNDYGALIKMYVDEPVGMKTKIKDLKNKQEVQEDGS